MRILTCLALAAAAIPASAALPVSSASAQSGATAEAGAGASALVWAKPGHFWYRKAMPGGNIWLTVDAEHGVKEPLFDHQRLAIELTLRTGVEYTPLTLPFADPVARFAVKYDGSNAYIQEGAMAIEFVLGGHQWRCELQIKWDWNKVPPTDYECLSGAEATAVTVESAAGPAPAPIASPDGRWHAWVENGNVMLRAADRADARPVALTSDGSATAAWQHGSIRWAADSRTVSAYRVDSRVWLSDGVSGNVRSLIAKGEWGTRMVPD